MWSISRRFVLPSLQHTFHEASGEGLDGWLIDLPHNPVLAFFEGKTVSWSSYSVKHFVLFSQNPFIKMFK